MLHGVSFLRFGVAAIPKRPDFGFKKMRLSIASASLDAMFQRAADLQVEVIWVDALNPRPRVWPAVSQLLRDRFPDLLERYRQMLFDSGARSRYMMELGQRVQRAAERVSLRDRILQCF